MSAYGLVRAGGGHRAPFGAHEPRRLDEHGAGPGGTEDDEWGRGRGGGRRTPEVSRPRGAENPRAPNTSAPRAAPPGERPEGLPGKGGRRDTRRRVCVCPEPRSVTRRHQQQTGRGTVRGSRSGPAGRAHPRDAPSSPSRPRGGAGEAKGKLELVRGVKGEGPSGRRHILHVETWACELRVQPNRVPVGVRTCPRVALPWRQVRGSAASPSAVVCADGHTTLPMRPVVHPATCPRRRGAGNGSSENSAQRSTITVPRPRWLPPSAKRFSRVRPGRAGDAMIPRFLDEGTGPQTMRRARGDGKQAAETRFGSRSASGHLPAGPTSPLTAESRLRHQRPTRPLGGPIRPSGSN